MRIHFGDFTVDPDSRQLLRGAEELHLGPKAFDLLDVLLENRPKALSKSRLQQLLWPRTFVTESNLTSLVRELRMALGDGAKRSRFVRTVYGYGYAFCGTAEDVVPPVPAASAVRLRLFLEEREIALHEGDNLFGRLDEAVGWIQAPSVSRRHARILVSGAKATLEDRGSKNGTFVGEERLTSPRALADGDEIRLGRVRMTFRVLPPLSTQTEVGR